MSNNSIIDSINNQTETVYQDFREFAVKNNITSLATAWVVGISTSQVIRSFVDEIIKPFLNLKSIAKYTIIHVKNIPINIGVFIVEIIHWVLMLLFVFLFVEYIFNRKIIKIKSKISNSEKKEIKQMAKEIKQDDLKLKNTIKEKLNNNVINVFNEFNE
jgi:large conductance mechanosensitive channel